MDLKHLRSFAAAAEEQSFTRAGERLHVTQAAVSQHIAALEKELGTPLFDRVGRRVELTDRGRRFYDYSRRILQLVHEAVTDAAPTESMLDGTLSIATSTIPAEWLLPGLLAGFLARHALVREALTVSDSKEAARSVEQGSVLLGFVGERPTSKKLLAEPIASDELLLVAAPDHSLASKRAISPAALQDTPMIAREPGSGTRRCVEESLKACGVDTRQLRIVMEVNSNEAIKLAVRRGSGVAFVSQHTAAEDIEDGRLVVIKVRGLRARRQLYLVTKSGQLLTSPASEFAAYVREQTSAANSPESAT